MTRAKQKTPLKENATQLSRRDHRAPGFPPPAFAPFPSLMPQSGHELYRTLDGEGAGLAEWQGLLSYGMCMRMGARVHAARTGIAAAGRGRGRERERKRES